MKCKFIIPPLPGNKVRIQGSIDFLKNQHLIGQHQFLWECPYSRQHVGFFLKRYERLPGIYYREPYPLTITIVAPKIYSFPDITYPLTESDTNEIISSLESELGK
jgi:hypothetical protein